MRDSERRTESTRQRGLSTRQRGGVTEERLPRDVREKRRDVGRRKLANFFDTTGQSTEGTRGSSGRRRQPHCRCDRREGKDETRLPRQHVVHDAATWSWRNIQDVGCSAGLWSRPQAETSPQRHGQKKYGCIATARQECCHHPSMLNMTMAVVEN